MLPDKDKVASSPAQSTDSVVAPESLLSQADKNSRGQLKKLLMLVFVGILILAVSGAAAFVLVSHNGGSDAPALKSPKVNPPVSQDPPPIDTSKWKTYTDPAIKISFQYPEILKDATIDLHPANGPSPIPDLIKSDVSVIAQKIVKDASGKAVDVAEISLVNVTTYTPGSTNDTRDRYAQGVYETTHITKQLSKNGIRGDCIHYTVTPPSSVKRYDYSCKFRKNDLVYEIVGGSSSDDRHFSDVDINAIRQKILETFQFNG